MTPAFSSLASLFHTEPERDLLADTVIYRLNSKLPSQTRGRATLRDAKLGFARVLQPSAIKESASDMTNVAYSPGNRGTGSSKSNTFVSPVFKH